MKKIIIVMSLIILCLTGCSKKEEKYIDYSNYLFTDINWIRDNGDDIETIRFNSNRSFSYSCSCGNSVNDADLCENYTYDEDKKEIKLDCFEKNESSKYVQERVIIQLRL